MKAQIPEMITLRSHEERVEYLDMICLMALHEVYGFGPVRLRRYYDMIVKMNDHYQRYNGKDEPLFGRRGKKDGMPRMDLLKVKADLKAIGVDYDALVEEGKAAKNNK